MAKSKNNKKRGISDALYAKKSGNQVKKVNPFEVHVNKQKFSILGRKLKHDRGLPGVSRAKAIRKRKETLGQEYLDKHKTNKFKDKRIGGNVINEEIATARFKAEMLNQYSSASSKRKSLFNLNDDEVLTHKGQTLEEIEQFQDTISDDEEDEEAERLNAEFTGVAHFGGNDDDNEFPKSRKEAIDDLIAETKRRKAEIAKEKDLVQNMTDKLDHEWKTLIPLMGKLSRGDEERPKPDDYDRTMREMIFEARGEPTDKLKSEEELAKIEKDRLDKLERERIRRMQGGNKKDNKPKHRSADDLDGDYFLPPAEENEGTVAYEINGKPDKESNAGNDDLESEDDNDDDVDLPGGNPCSDNDSEEESSGEEDDNLSDLKVDSESESEVDQPKPVKKHKKEKCDKITTEEDLPFTFDLPQKYEELAKLLKNQNAEIQNTILERMIKCNHPKIEPTNKEKMVTLFTFLLQHINDIFANATAETVINCFQILDRICPHLFDLAQMNPIPIGNCMREVIKQKQSDYSKTSKQYPTLETLVFLKIVSLLFSTSDFKNGVVTPCFIFMSQMLSRCRVQKRSDIATGLFLVTLILEYTQLSKRFIPSALNFLNGIIYLCTPKRSVEILKIIPPFKKKSQMNSILVLQNDHLSTKECSFKMEAKDLVMPEIDDSFKLRALHVTIGLIRDVTDQLKESTIGIQYIAIDFLSGLEKLNPDTYPEETRALLSSTIATIQKAADHPLKYLVTAERAPRQLRLLEPKIEKVFDDKRRPAMSKEKAIRETLIHKVKRETKGAIREIRRDNAFLAKMQIKRQIQSDLERKEKVRRIFSEASIQQGELKAIDRRNKKTKF